MKRLSLLAVTAAALIAAGCGEDQTFIDDYNTATKPLQTLASDINSAVSGAGSKSDSALATQFNKLADGTKETTDKLDELEAPDDAKADFDKLKAALRDGEKTLRDVAAAAGKGDAQGAAAAVEQLGKDGQAITAAENAVASKVES